MSTLDYSAQIETSVMRTKCTSEVERSPTFVHVFPICCTIAPNQDNLHFQEQYSKYVVSQSTESKKKKKNRVSVNPSLHTFN